MTRQEFRTFIEQMLQNRHFNLRELGKAIEEHDPEALPLYQEARAALTKLVNHFKARFE